MQDSILTINENSFISGKLWLMRLKAPQLAGRVKGGHFVMIEVSPTYDPMGRRAFAIGDVRGDEILIFYDVVGRGTYLLSTMKKGDKVRVFGPLGKRLFSYEGEKHLLIGGGVGLAGLSLYGKELRAMGKEVVFVYGARSAEHLGMLDWLRDESFEYVIFTDDGSAGRKGLVTDILREFDREWVVSACGPKPMLKALSKLSQETGHRVFMSLEERMACGWGVCLGCVVKNPQGAYQRVCYEGPVFEASEVVF
ncbi:dihydroorotate dehydrogenase electron transfer subunit [Hydrogenivirga caldilitoris]|uniref:Dihydroorotate dehydrogenase electron transfer subunit n=1 Tax=Hydrogenivirga caldilitoris TaxID=246264 RepID=A0A497XT34_9AQUI|nr:dihydroorotate dehydrogenase electron transfer subunit [Hydrogenivirga caldilitoris]RLJ70073.1 dihydroorotate dehydrogenase electron transfer subunit [Hydrogenivirga caldilitoris]